MKIAATADTRNRQEELGQFLTAKPVADFMASMFGPLPRTVRLLDAGAGAGALTAAFVARCCEKRHGVRAIEAVTSAGPVDGKRRKELKDLFAGCQAGLVFVTAFETRRTMQSFLSHIAWESEVWIAEDPDHMIHFNGERFLGPYPDVMPPKP